MRQPGRLRGGVVLLVLSVLAFLPGCGRGDGGAATEVTVKGLAYQQAASADNVVLQWNTAAVEAERQSGMIPTALARALAMVNTCMYDAWAAYDDKAVGTRLGADLRRPAAQHTLTNQEQAVSFAAYRAAVDLFPAQKGAVFDPLMTRLGFDPSDTSTNRATPVGVGNVACQAVLDFRHGDGANQLANVPGGTANEPYSDYTGYKPVNTPMDLRVPFDPAGVKDVGRWQPLTYIDDKGAVVTPTFLTPHWNKVIPFALSSAAQLRSATGPAKPGTDQFKAQAQAVLDASANLTERQKVICQYWAAGPNKELPPGYWDDFAQFVSRRDGHARDLKGTEADVKMFFTLTNALFDASIVGWDSKVHFDYVRRITAIRSLFQGQTVKAWGGAGKGTLEMDGGAWLPYHPVTFPTPPFAEYGSGHSVFGGAGAELLKRITGSDTFGHSATIKAGTSGYEPGVPATDLTLSWKTFTEAGDEAGISRIYCGMHFSQGNTDALDQGRKVAGLAYDKAQVLFAGQSATPAPADTLPRTE